MTDPAPGVLYIIVGDTILAEATSHTLNIERDIPVPIFMFEDEFMVEILDEDLEDDYRRTRDPKTRKKPGGRTRDPRATRRGGRDPPSFFGYLFVYYIYIIYICLMNERGRGRITP
jgi:hypothetical protein